MKKEQSKIMQSFIDKLCDHLPSQRIKHLIDNGFEQWETITYMKGDELIDLGFDTQECIIIMVAANSNAIEHEQVEIFSEDRMQEIIANAKQRDQERQEQILKEEQKNQKKTNKVVSPESQKSINTTPSAHNIKQYPHKQISEALIAKGTFIKSKPGEKINLAKVTMITLGQKEITHIANLEKCHNLINLHLGNNHIYRIEGLHELTKLKDLKLEHNNISKIEGLDNLVSLQLLNLSSNYISRLENLTNNTKLQQLFISKQKININFTFDQQTTAALAYTLQKFECNQNKVRSITELKHLKVVKEVYLAKNQLQDVGQLSETINGMQNLRILSFKDNPLTKSQKYRDYIVILSKTLEQLDGKKILAKEREYLVKLYALKHAKQEQDNIKPKLSPKTPNIDLQGVKMQEQYGQYNANINRATDLRGNMPYANTKHGQK